MTFLELDMTTKVVRKICAFLCEFVYWLIAKIYELFITVARLNILTDGFGPIYQRITMMLTIVMTFYITFEFVKYTVQPDNFTDSEKGAGNILKRIVIVVALIAFMPNIFSLAYELQSKVIETNIISKIILGTTTTDYTKFGNDFSANTLELFYFYDEEVCASGGGKCKEAEETVKENLDNIRENGKVEISDTINLESNAGIAGILKEKYPAINFTFNGFLPLIIGGFIAYILVMYSIDVGVRYAQLIFLQAMAPVAIMGYILPKKDSIFQKWGKQCITTYLDVFLRLIIINFVLLLSKVLGEAFSSPNSVIFAGIGGVSDGLRVFVYIILILGLLVFAQRAPKLLGELFPSLGGAGGIGFGLSAKDRVDSMKKSFGSISGVAKAPYTAGKKVFGAGARVVGGVGGAIAGLAIGKGLGGKFRAAGTGAKEGFNKDNKGLPLRRIERAREAARQRLYQEEAIARSVAPTGMTQEQAVREATYHKERWANIAAEQDRKSKLFDTPSTGMDNINKTIDEFKQIKAIKQELESAKSRGASAAEVKTLDAQYKSAVQTMRRLVAQSTDKNGNFDVATFKTLAATATFDKKLMDENGFQIKERVVPVYEVNKATGEKKIKIDPNTNKPVMVVEKVVPEKVKIQIDESGDFNYTGSVSRTIGNELTKIKTAATEVVGTKADGSPLTIGDTLVTINVNGTDVKKSVNEWLKDSNEIGRAHV